MLKNVLLIGCNGLTPSESKLCACVDQGLTFNCTINGSGITEWSGSAFDCPGGILLRHLNFMDGTMGICNSGQIVGRSLGVDNGCYSSQLTVNATASLNNTSVQCVHNLLGEKNTIGVISLTVISGKIHAHVAMWYKNIALKAHICVPLPPLVLKAMYLGT